MLDRMEERLARYTGARSGGEISTMTSSAMGMSFDLVTNRIGYHHGEDQARTSSLQKMGSLAL